MIKNDNLVHSNDCMCFSWKPVFAGALIIMGLTFLLNLFSTAIGLTAFTTGSDGVESIALGGLLGTAIGIIASMFAAGWLTGYLGQRYCSKRHLGCLYGFLAWCLALIFAIFLAAHAQEYIYLYTHVLSGNHMLTHPTVNAAVEAVNQMPSKSLVISTYIIFSLFFLSAFACSLGGHCGMRYVYNKDSCNY